MGVTHGLDGASLPCRRPASEGPQRLPHSYDDPYFLPGIVMIVLKWSSMQFSRTLAPPHTAGFIAREYRT